MCVGRIHSWKVRRNYSKVEFYDCCEGQDSYESSKTIKARKVIRIPVIKGTCFVRCDATQKASS